MRNNGVPCPFFGISVNRDQSQSLENLYTWWDALAELLPADSSVTKEPFEVFIQSIGSGYGDPTEACLDGSC